MSNGEPAPLLLSRDKPKNVHLHKTLSFFISCGQHSSSGAHDSKRVCRYYTRNLMSIIDDNIFVRSHLSTLKGLLIRLDRFSREAVLMDELARAGLRCTECRRCCWVKLGKLLFIYFRCHSLFFSSDHHQLTTISCSVQWHFLLICSPHCLERYWF